MLWVCGGGEVRFGFGVVGVVVMLFWGFGFGCCVF